MFIFDQLKRNDRSLQAISFGVLIGMVVLLGGLWFVQIVSASQFKENFRKQSLREVRLPAVRGKILDRNGKVLAENRPRYNVNLYLEELRDEFEYEYTNNVKKEFRRDHPKDTITLTLKQRLQREAAYRVVSNITFRVTSALQQPAILSTNRFLEHYVRRTFVPFPILQNLTTNQIARFAEQLSMEPSIELELQPVRTYPHGSTAAHLLGYVQRERDDSDFSQPDYIGKTGIEHAFDAQLRGQPGTNFVLVNNMSYRQREETVESAPGANVTLTIDVALQAAAERALANRAAGTGGAAIVMDVRNGDILALASDPTFDPNKFVDGISSAEYARLNGEKKHMFNRATFGAYQPGSTFKIVTGLACLEYGINPKDEIYNPGYFQAAHSPRIKDTAEPGYYNFERAFCKSSNTYFITNGLKAGLKRILDTGKRFHLGERTKLGGVSAAGELVVVPEVAGDFPTAEEATGLWPQGRLANACIGQEITVTPVQLAAMTAAIANGGELFWPRIVSSSKAPEGSANDEVFSADRIREHIQFNPQHLKTLREAMFADTEHGPEDKANAYDAFHSAFTHAPLLKNADQTAFHVGGKTGTAEIKPHPGVIDHTTWFVSYAPFETPRYAVVVMVESGASGGKTCAPVAEKIYEAILKREQVGSAKPALARN